MYLLQQQQQHESVRQHNILCGMKVSHRRVNALTNKRDEDPRNESSTLNLLLENVIAVGFYIPRRSHTAIKHTFLLQTVVKTKSRFMV